MTENDVEVEVVSCSVCGSVLADLEAVSTDYEYETTKRQFFFVRCRECGHVYLNPRPSISSAHVIYPKNYYTVSGGKRRIHLVLAALKDKIIYSRVRSLLRYVPLGGSVLEVGAGDGSLVLGIRARRNDLKLTALDFQFSEYAKTRMSNAHIDVIEAPLELAELSHKYNLIVLNQLIEHVWDVRGSISKLAGALLPGGVISMSTPDLNGYDRQWFVSGTWGGYYTPRHLNIFSNSALDRICADYGLSLRTSRPLIAPMIWVRSCHNWLKQKGSPASSLFVDENVLFMMSFALIDKLAILLGKRTSNQQLIYVSNKHVGDS